MDFLISIFSGFLLIGLFMLLLTVVLYITTAHDKRDALYFLRKKQFKQKIAANGQDNLSGFLGSIMNAAKTEWAFDDGWIVYQVYPNTKVSFSNVFEPHLKIAEGRSNITVVNLGYVENLQELSIDFDPISNETLNEEERFRIKHAMTYLKDLFNAVYSEHITTVKKQKQQKESVALNERENKQAQLLALLKNGPFYGLEMEENGFLIRFKYDEQSRYLEISLDKVVYFQAIQMRNHSMNTTILHQQSKEAAIFMECAAELYDYARTLFYIADRAGQTGHSTKETETKEKTSYHDTDFESSFKEHLMPIRQLLKELACEEKWLSVESYHQITETFPNDLHALGEAVSVVTHQEKAKEYADEALHIIYKKLLDFKHEAENNKLKAVERQKRIIEKR